jgi:hypothetical protein
MAGTRRGDILRLTNREKMVWEIRNAADPPLEWDQIGKKLEISPEKAFALYASAQAKTEQKAKKKGSQEGFSGRNVEETRPEQSAVAIDKLTEPFGERFKQICLDAGLPERTTMSLQKRLQGRYLPVRAEIEKVKTADLLAMTSEKAKMIIDAIDDEDILAAGLRDKAVAYGILIDKRQLLSGEPTQILSFEERRHLDQIVPLLLREAQRRGIVMDVDPISSEVRMLDKEGIGAKVKLSKERVKDDANT